MISFPFPFTNLSSNSVFWAMIGAATFQLIQHFIFRTGRVHLTKIHFNFWHLTGFVALIMPIAFYLVPDSERFNNVSSEYATGVWLLWFLLVNFAIVPALHSPGIALCTLRTILPNYSVAMDVLDLRMLDTVIPAPEVLEELRRLRSLGADAIIVDVVTNNLSFPAIVVNRFEGIKGLMFRPLQLNPHDNILYFKANA